MIALNKYSIGVGDRFAHQAKAQLRAVQKAREKGVHITPVWNKSYREHQIIGSDSLTTREQADLAVQDLKWEGNYFVDADHINLSNVGFFMDTCDFFTLDVADDIGKSTSVDDVRNFVQKHQKYCGELALPGLETRLTINESLIQEVARKYLYAVERAAELYIHIAETKSPGSFIIEVSMDETEEPQQPVELFFILAALSDLKIPVQTIAPKFSGRFNKGVDYVGDLTRFKTEFEQDVAVIKLAVKEFALPERLKLSLHSGSDKFSIYPLIRDTIRKLDAGLHLKTAGTSWLEELIGLAEAGGEGLDIAKDIYFRSLEKYEDLCAPYETVIDIDPEQLPGIEEVEAWDGGTFAGALCHDLNNKHYNLHFRQLLHVGYQVAADMGGVYISALKENRKHISNNVTANIFERHIEPLFM